MKKFIKKITHTAKSAVTCVKTAAVNSMSAVLAFNRRAVCSNAGEGYIDTAVKVLIAVVLLGSVVFRLPYSQELEEQYLAGELLADLSMKDSRAFRKEIDRICEEVF